MRLITRELNAVGAVERWASQYPAAMAAYSGEDKQVILRKLKELGENPDPDDVDSVIENGSWTGTKCDECGSENVAVIRFGHETDYDITDVCRECLMKALELECLV